MIAQAGKLDLRCPNNSLSPLTRSPRTLLIVSTSTAIVNAHATMVIHIGKSGTPGNTVDTTTSASTTAIPAAARCNCFMARQDMSNQDLYRAITANRDVGGGPPAQGNGGPLPQ